MRRTKFSELEYKPTKKEEIVEHIFSLSKKIKEATNAEEVEKYLKEAEQSKEEVSFQYTLTYIRNSLDYRDEFYQKAVLREGEALIEINLRPVYEQVLQSPYFSVLEDKYGENLKRVLEKEIKLNQAGQELMTREHTLITEYQTKKAALQIDFCGEKRTEAQIQALFNNPKREIRLESRKILSETILQQSEEFSLLLEKLIRTRHELAKANGYDNYLLYANEQFSRYGYGEEELKEFCRQVKEELIPIQKELEESQRQRLGVEKLMVYDQRLYFAKGNPVPVGEEKCMIEQAQEMYKKLSPRLASFFKEMVWGEYFNIKESDTKVAGMGFCAELKKGMLPYIFGNCNRTQDDVSVFTHEIGHAWQTMLSSKKAELRCLREMPLDAIEIPSKSMELFTSVYAEDFFGKDGDRYREVCWREIVQEILAFCAIHELEGWIYTHPESSFAEIVEKYREIEEEYHPNTNWGELEEYDKLGVNLMRNMAIYMFPRYVISYALSWLCALDLFEELHKDPHKGWIKYEKLCSMGGEYIYPMLLKVVGLSPSYEKGRVKNAAAVIKKMLHLS